MNIPLYILKNEEPEIIISEIWRLVDEYKDCYPAISALLREKKVRLSFPIEDTTRVLALILYLMIESSSGTNLRNPVSKKYYGDKFRQILPELGLDPDDFAHAIGHIFEYQLILKRQDSKMTALGESDGHNPLH